MENELLKNTGTIETISTLEDAVTQPTRRDKIENLLNKNSNINSSDTSNLSESSITESPNFLENLQAVNNPHLKELDYIENEIPIYANLYKLELIKNYNLYEYALKFSYLGDTKNEIPTILKKKITSKVGSKITQIYGNYIFIGNAFYAMKKVDEITQINIDYNSVDYLIDIQPTKKIIEMKKDTQYMVDQYTRGKYEIKTIFEIMVREILSHNPSLKYVMYLFGKKDEEQLLEAKQEYNSINITPGFVTKVMILESGIFLNVDIKTKILSNMNCLQLIGTFLNDPKKPTKHEIKEANEWIHDKTIETTHSNQRFKVEEINFDRKAGNLEIKQEGRKLLLVKYYKEYFNIDINPNSPLLLVKSTKRNSKGYKWLPPELCVIVGLSDEMMSDGKLIKDITKRTKLAPNDKINSINDIIKLMNEKKQIMKYKIIKGVKKEVMCKSSYEVKEEYGINILEPRESEKFIGKIMKLPIILGKDGNEIKNISRTFNVSESIPISSLCIFQEKNKDIAKNLKKYMLNAAKGYDIYFENCDFKHAKSQKFEDWAELLDKCIKKNKYNLITLLIDDYLDNQGLYDKLKIYAQEVKGIITQFIKTNSLRKNAMSVVSNILIQMNTKIGGVSYTVHFDEEINEKNLMIIGVDSSRLEDSKGKVYQSIAFCATTNNEFTHYTNKKTLIFFEDYDNTNLPIAKFMEMALVEYFEKNKRLPGGVVIYRQGTSFGQKQYLSDEIEQLYKIFNGESEEKAFKGMKIPFYYIIVNKKTSLKFFEIEANNKNRNNDKEIYDNPDSGLLVIDKLVNPNKFEFYIQPQKVTQGTATPTCYQVEYGNLDCPKIIPKLTFDLCFLYSNWRGPVRIPAPLKYAEKLAKSKAGINDDIKNSLSYI